MTPTKSGKRHHHGNLRKALIDAGIELLSEGGIPGLTLRRCAARTGVSHAAPAHHFKGLKDLLTAIVTEAFKIFTQTMINEREAAANDPRSRLMAVCEGYLIFARNYEALATLMFMPTDIISDDPDYQAASRASYLVLAEACAPFNSGRAGQRGIEVMIWSLVQGYSSLVRTGQVDTGETPFADILPLLDLQKVET